VGEVDVPCFVSGSPHSGITTDILVDVLTYLDTLKVFPCDAGLPALFIIVDDHNSRFGAAFLQYIPKEKNTWHVCIGVPYGTHLWKAADTQQKNGNFKSA
jgi:hypothetical protein